MNSFVVVNVFVSLWLCVVRGDEGFDYLMFAQQLPGAMCLVQDETGTKSCVVPQQATPWTVHGLWPSRFSGQDPQFCHNPGRKFDYNKIKPIEGELLQKWPNILPDQGESSLWKHEWEKHGSCAEALPDLGGELKYFQKSIDLHDQFDVFKALSAAGITPSADQSYSREQIVEAVRKIVADNTIIPHCVKDLKNGKWYIASIRLCVDKSFSTIDCGSHIEEDEEDEEETWNTGSNGKLPSLQDCPADNLFYPPTEQSDRTPIIYQDVPRTIDAWEWLFRLTPLGLVWNIIMQP